MFASNVGMLLHTYIDLFFFSYKHMHPKKIHDNEKLRIPIQRMIFTRYIVFFISFQF